jgi:hypothetical protein
VARAITLAFVCSPSGSPFEEFNAGNAGFQELDALLCERGFKRRSLR